MNTVVTFNLKSGTVQVDEVDYLGVPRLNHFADGPLPADGETTALVTYEGPGERVTFEVNGVECPVEVEDHKAEIEVAASVPGPITIKVLEHGLSLELEAVEA